MYQHLKKYENFYGIDLKSNDLDTDTRYATSTNNVEIAKTGELEKRIGYHPHAESDSFGGLFTYNRASPTTGAQTLEILGASDTLKRLEKSTILVTYTGSEDNARLSVFYDPITSQYRCQIEIGTSTVLDSALGLGRDEVGPKTVNDLKNEIDALADLTATITGSTTVPAAFIETTWQCDLTVAPCNLVARYWSSLNVCPQTGKSGPLLGTYTNRNTQDFENASSVVLQNCLYVSNGYDEVVKYDGQNVYRAGVPTPSTITASGTAGTTEVYVWRSQYVQVDAVGNICEGNLKNSSEYVFTQPSVNPVTVTVASILAGSGFNTNCALISGIGTGTVIPVTVGHTMKAGDTAFLWDTVSSKYVTRSVVSVAATTVTVDSSIGYTSSTTNSRNVISNNLRIRIVRNQNTTISPTVFYEVIDIPNNSLGAGTQTYVDTLSDIDLLGHVELLEPATDRSPPIKGKYISAFQTLMVTAGDPENVNNVSVSDYENCEYFPFPDNQFQVENLQGDAITGIHPSNEHFLIFQSRAIHAMTGDVPAGNFRVDTITTDIGCIAHATIQDVRGSVCFMSPVGPRTMQGASVPKGLGAFSQNQFNSRIDPLFSQKGVESQYLYRLKRSLAINDRRGEKYIVMVPCESTNSVNDVYTNSNSVMLSYDYTRDAWLTWTNLDATGGMITANEDQDIYFIERRSGEYEATVNHYVYRFHTTGTNLDYQDHNQAINWEYKSAWEFLGNAGVRKNFQAIRIHSVKSASSECEIVINTEGNFIPDATLSSCSISFEGSGYGEMAYGVDPYGTPSVTALKHKLNNGRVTSLRVILSNAEEQTNVSITGYELEIAAPYKPAFKT